MNEVENEIWKIDRESDKNIWILAGDEVIMNICSSFNDETNKYEPTEEEEARAKLVVTAPRLKRALKILQPKLEMLINMTPTGEDRNLLTEQNIQLLGLLNE